MTDSKLVSREDVASRLADFFDREVEDSDLLLVRETAEGKTVAVTSFGNKVEFDGDDITVLMGPGPGEQDLEPRAASELAPEAPDEPQADLPPLEGTAADDEAQGYEAQTVEDLKDELRERDLPVSGTKDELIARLEEDDNAEDEDDEEA